MSDLVNQEDIDGMLSVKGEIIKQEIAETSLIDVLKNEIAGKVTGDVKKEISVVQHRVSMLERENEAMNEIVKTLAENQKPVKKQKIVISTRYNSKIITINEKHDYLGTIKYLTSFADKARKEGILTLEGNIRSTQNEFMKMGLMLAIDGIEPDLIRDILETDINGNKKRAEFSIRLYSALSNFVFVLGILMTLSAVIGLDKFENFMLLPATIGLFIKYVVFGSGIWLKKLKIEKDMTLNGIIVEGIMSIQAGDNPRIVEQKLLMYLPKHERENF
jgi:chemotaxis protein MotA